MKVLGMAVLLAFAQTITAAETAGSSSSSYEQCTLDQYEFIIDDITPFAGSCTKKTGYNFVKFPYPTDAQKTQFCTDCPDLVAKIKTITPAHCRVNVFDSETGVPLKEVLETLFGKCGVTDVKEEGGSSTPTTKDKEGEEYGSGSHDSDDDKTAGTNSSGEVTKSTTPVPSPTSAASTGAVVTMGVSFGALGVLASLV